LNKFIDRDISWLSFNERVLQEAEDQFNPLLERLKFLAIFSSNLEEFYKVRVARQRHFAYAKINKANKFGYRPTEILKTIYRTVDKQQRRFGKIYFKTILPELHQHNYQIVQNLEDDELIEEALKLFDNVKDSIVAENITKKEDVFLKNQVNYLLVVVKKAIAYKYFLVEIGDDLKRFHLYETEAKSRVYFVDDVIRAGLKQQFGEQYVHAYAIKLSRDAELYLEDEPLSSDLKKKIADSLKKRDSGVPTRFLFDELIPYRFLNDIMVKTNSDREALIPGGRYHRFYDFFAFPKLENPNLYFPEEEVLPSKTITKEKPLFDQVLEKDILLSFPYQDYQQIVDVLEEASEHPDVVKIQITLYRVAKDSLICQSLERAVKNGKKVVVYTELKARFDESSNLYWNKRLKDSGALIYDEVAELKTHAKVFQIEMKGENGVQKIAHLGTGNFNEKTASIYTDFSLLTSNLEINDEVSQLFEFLTAKTKKLKTDLLLTSPYSLRKQVEAMIDREIAIAQKGTEARIIIKLNSLEDTAMIEKLYQASQAGVQVDLIIRGICCLKAGVEGLSENIRLVSIVGRYLEHARCYYFLNQGGNEIYCSSADFMSRNLDKRVEVGFPLLNKVHKEFMLAFLELQLNDNVKQRQLNHKLQNNYVIRSTDQSEVEAQVEIQSLIREYKL